jgi:hypothetical protein
MPSAVSKFFMRSWHNANDSFNLNLNDQRDTNESILKQLQGTSGPA